ncbi:aldose 1-epimerase family protein [Paenibacillus sp. MBLB4367]|uniref:aldose 1-epimerase family protein n=1 Tax=Paenibacillus sp. MBLB4367 TaxID=3384767 RepID=UPI0039081034
MKLYDREWTRTEIETRVGRIEQIGGIQRVRGTEGMEDGVELVRVRTGAGLTYEVSPSRGMDIGMSEFAGVPIGWQAPGGIAHPAYYDAQGTEWLRTAAGGLLMTCGLSNVGSPCEDGGRRHGLHGRIHHLPARHVGAEGVWDGDEYEMTVKGTIDETSIFGDHLRLTREIRSRLGENVIRIRDRVENAGFTRAGHMMLYHFNFGFPLMDEHTEIEFPGTAVFPREPETPAEGYDRWQPPEAGFKERVYVHRDIRSVQGRAYVRIGNERFPRADGGVQPLCAELSWSTKHLPHLVQWKMPGQGVYVLGLEPANCAVDGRAAERQRGTLVRLEPGESIGYELELAIKTGANAV